MLDGRTVFGHRTFCLWKCPCIVADWFGKSLFYGLLVSSIALEDAQKHSRFRRFVTPLASLMIDQKARFLPQAGFLGDIQHDVRALQRVKEDVEQKLVF